jgi:hypothetical protein
LSVDVDRLRAEVFRRFPHRCPEKAEQLTGWSPRHCSICRWVLEKITGVEAFKW